MTGAAVAGRTLAHDARAANVGAESKLTRWHARRPRLLENAFASGILAGQLPAPTVLGADQ